MSWMDSWSRPSKSQATPPPLYLTNPETRYCTTCGRVISDRKSHKTDPTPAKYCSVKCRSQKPRKKDLRIEEAFVALLNGDKEFEGEEIPAAISDLRVKAKAKGEKRFVVPCSAVETLIYGSRGDPSKVFGRKKNRASRALAAGGEKEWRSVDMESTDEEEGDDGMIDFNTTGFAGKVRPPQHLTEINGGIGGEKGRAEREEESAEANTKRLEGQRIAEEKELVKRAARRGVVFGFAASDTPSETPKKCEAIMGANVVEPSFAKGDWGVRWRE